MPRQFSLFIFPCFLNLPLVSVREHRMLDGRCFFFLPHANILLRIREFLDVLTRNRAKKKAKSAQRISMWQLMREGGLDKELKRNNYFSVFVSLFSVPSTPISHQDNDRRMAHSMNTVFLVIHMATLTQH
jgi:hypothetical protein